MKISIFRLIMLKKITLDSNLVWKGCLTVSQFDYLTHYPVGKSLASALGIMYGVPGTTAYTFDVCSDSMCNHGTQIVTSSRPLISLAYLLLYIGITFYLLHSY